MKISKKVGRMALNALGTAPIRWNKTLWDLQLELRQDGQRFEWITIDTDHSDTLLCLIASIAGVKPD